MFAFSPFYSTTIHCAGYFHFLQGTQQLIHPWLFHGFLRCQSLFTNVPLEESIDLAVKYILEGRGVARIFPEVRTIFKSTLARQFPDIVSTFLGCICFSYQYGEVTHEWMEWHLGRKACCRFFD